MAEESQSKPITIELIANFVGAIGLIGLATAVYFRRDIPYPISDQHFLIIFAVVCAIPYIASWRHSIRAGHLPVMPMGTPKHRHITGWGFLTLAFSIGVIVGLAAWAAPGSDGGRQIQASWGVTVVAGLAVFFIVAALAPHAPEAPRTAKAIGKFVGAIVSPFGRILSVTDSMLVFAVAPAVGASRARTLTRYFLLAATLVPCALMGYWLAAPWGLAPLAWGFIVAIAVSRRWAWVEDDRELSMLNRKYTGSHLRVGFGQDLRDEALLSFMSMFFLVPLALSQAEQWSMAIGNPLFSLDREVSLLDWIGFYGTELAKAVPFVDWAEIYNVGGVAPIDTKSDTGRHVVFATRVLVDLVFLAALLQAIGISTRNAKQKDLFYGDPQALDRLDPFVEPKEFRKLLKKDEDGSWAANPDAIASFPKYDSIRLGELVDPDRHPGICLAAKALRLRDGAADSDTLHDELLRRTMQTKPEQSGIREVITGIRTAGPQRNAYELGQARASINRKPAMNELRGDITRLLIEASDDADKLAALVSILHGPDTDAILAIRRMALNALTPFARKGDPTAMEAVREVAKKDYSSALKNNAQDILRDLNATAD